MRALFVVLACFLFVPSYGQLANCNDLIVENSRIGATHYLKTTFIKVIVRSNYSYSLCFQNSDQGIFIVVQSLNGGVFNLNDEIIFINEKQERIRIEIFVRDNLP